MKVRAVRCKNCKYSKHINSPSGNVCLCLKYNKRVNKNYYCGNVPALYVED